MSAIEMFAIFREIKARGCRNVDALPYNTTDAPFYVGYVTKQVCDDLRALAPDILLTS